MTRRLWTVYKHEVAKAVRLKFTYLGPILVLLAVCCAPLMHPITRDDVSDYGFIAYATPLALNLIGVLVILLYCANLMSSELGSGTLRMLLVRPVYRHDVLAAKLLLGMTYVVLLTALVTATSWGLAFAFGDLRGVTYGGEQVYSNAEMASAYGLGLLVNLCPQFAAVAFALMLSSFTSSAGAAVGSTVGIWILLDTLKYPLGIAPYLFTSYMETSWRVFQDRANVLPPSDWFPTTGYCILASAVSFVLCMAISTWVLSRRDLSA